MKQKQINYQQRLHIVKECVQNNLNYTETARKYSVLYSQLYTWVKKYLQFGEEGLIDKRGKMRNKNIENADKNGGSDKSTVKPLEMAGEQDAGEASNIVYAEQEMGTIAAVVPVEYTPLHENKKFAPLPKSYGQALNTAIQKHCIDAAATEILADPNASGLAVKLVREAQGLSAHELIRTAPSAPKSIMTVTLSVEEYEQLLARLSTLEQEIGTLHAQLEPVENMNT